MQIYSRHNNNQHNRLNNNQQNRHRVNNQVNPILFDSRLLQNDSLFSCNCLIKL